MVRIAWSAAVFAVLFVILWGCVGPDNAARKSIFEGRRFLETGDYGPARQDFIKAAQVRPTAEAYAFAATASYKMNDMEAANRATFRRRRNLTGSPISSCGFSHIKRCFCSKRADGRRGSKRSACIMIATRVTTY